MRLARIAVPSAILLAAACSKEVKLIPPTTPKEGQAVRARTLGSSVMDADSTHPVCPVRIRYDAELTVSKLTGKLQYQWIRSTGEKTPVRELDIPVTAKNGEAVLPIEPDIWPLTRPDSQFTFSEYIHILSPIDTRTQNMDVTAKCYAK